MKFVLILTFLWTILRCNPASSQQTVGVFTNTVDSYNGYTMFAPMGNKTTFLINNCGEKVHSWLSNYKPSLSAYFLENGTLLRTRNTQNSTFVGGGSGGGIEMLDWNGNVIWEYTISSAAECQHHDIEYLPNGNILAIVWEAKSATEAAQAGRETSGATLWSEKIIEIQPDLLNGGGSLVWEWHVWDHLVQDFDSTKDDFGTVSTSPQLLNINYNYANPIQADWLHFNAVNYNAELDQIMISCHNFSELWIIDHATTSAQAASHLGGAHNKGGDLLYRWGNPEAYDQGTVTNQLLFRQHDTHWITDSLADGGKILVFNNQVGSNYSQVNIISPPIDATGNYTYSGISYSPSAFDWTYQATTPSNFFASNISGAQRLPNGNTLICAGPAGEFFEVTTTGEKVWKYINPVSSTGIITQGNTPNQNSVFRASKYPVNYAGFIGHSLTPQGYIESGSTFTCALYSAEINENILSNSPKIYPNPTDEIFKIDGINLDLNKLKIYNLLGEELSKEISVNQSQINISRLPSGMYFLEIGSYTGKINKK